MNKRNKFIRTVAFFVSFLILTMTLNVGVAAAPPVIDVDAVVSVTIIHTESSVPVVGEVFRLYKVADVDMYGSFELIPPFTDYPVDIKADTIDEWRGVAGALDGYVQYNSVAPLSEGVTDSEGKISFSTDEKMTPGLYLVGGTQHIQGDSKYISAPFCITLPMFDESGEELIYDVTARPKFSSKINTGGSESTITRRVLKKWDDGGNKESRPDKVSVSLLKDGEVFSTVELNKDNNWAYTWQELDCNSQWTVIENDPGDYKVTVSLEGVTFLLTNIAENTPGEDPSDPDDPEVTTRPGEDPDDPEVTTRPGEDPDDPEVTTRPGEDPDDPEVTTRPGEDPDDPEVTTRPGEDPDDPEVTTRPGEDPDDPEVTTRPGEDPDDPEVTTRPGEDPDDPEVTTRPGEDPDDPEVTTRPGEDPDDPEVTTRPGEDPDDPEVTTRPGEDPDDPEVTTRPGEDPDDPEVTTRPGEDPDDPEVTTRPGEDPDDPEVTTRPGEDPDDPEGTTDEEGSFTLPGDEPTRKPEEEEKLPHTGQLWWPVPTLIAAGLLSIVLGQLRNRRWEDEE